MLKILKSKKGITLVELIIGMVVLAIILATVSAILFPMMRFQTRANELAEQNAMLDSLANQIIYDISMAMNPIRFGDDYTEYEFVIPVPATVGGNVTYFLTAEGIILREQAGYTNPLLPGEFHLRMTQAGMRVASMELEPTTNTETETIYTLELTLSNGDLTFTRNYAVRPLALN